jgi:hypothetical protein
MIVVPYFGDYDPSLDSALVPGGVKREARKCDIGPNGRPKDGVVLFRFEGMPRSEEVLENEYQTAIGARSSH